MRTVTRMPDWLPHNLAEAVLFTPLRIVFLLVLAVVVRFVACRLIDRSVELSIKQPGAARWRAAAKQINRIAVITDQRRAQRLRALGGLGRSVVTVLIALITAFTILSELQFNIASLLAGTSIVAVTIAFGLQNVVKDLVSGVFMLAEDQLGVGDWVQLDQTGGSGQGQVEEVGLRITRLRMADGTVCAVRNGEVLRVLNYSQGGPDRLPDPEPDDDGGGSDDETPEVTDERRERPTTRGADDRSTTAAGTTVAAGATLAATEPPPNG